MNDNTNLTSIKSLFVNSIIIAGYFQWASTVSDMGFCSNVVLYISGCVLFIVCYMIFNCLFTKIKRFRIAELIGLVVGIGCLGIWVLFSLANEPKMTDVGDWARFHIPTWLYLVIILSVTYSLYTGSLDSKKNNFKLRLITTIPIILMQSMLLYAPNPFRDMRNGVFHIGAYVTSIINTVHLQPYSDINLSIYGHYGLFFIIPVKILSLFGKTEFSSIVFVISLYGTITFACLAYLLNELIQNDFVFIFAMLAETVVSAQIYGEGQYYQLFPHRLLFQAIILVGCWCALKYKKIYKSVWLLCICAIIWNLEVGVICLAGWMLCVFYLQYFIIQRRSILVFLGDFFTGMLCVIAAYITVNIYNFLRGGSWNDIGTFIYPHGSQIYRIQDLMLKLPNIFSGHFLVICIYLIVLCYFGNQLWQGKGTDKKAFSIICAVMGLGVFTYYMNRTAYRNAVISHLEFMLILAMICDIQVKEKKLIITGGFRNIIVDELLIKTLVKRGGFVILSIFVLGTISNLDNAFINRVETTWNTTGFEEFCKKIDNEVPEDAIAIGKYVSIIYSKMNRTTGCYMIDWSDVTPQGILYVKEIIDQSSAIFIHDSSRGKLAMEEWDLEWTCVQSYHIEGESFSYWIRKE